MDIQGGLHVSGLDVTAGEAPSAVTIASGITFDVRPGEAVAIVGESGSGKSLTAKAVLDLLPANLRAGGEVLYGDHDLGSMPARERRRLRGRELALVMQDPFTMLNPLERVGDQITEPLEDERGRRLDRARRRQEAEQRLREVGITDPAVVDRYPFELSGGMRQRVGIAAAIAQRPHVLIADEPTTALDVTTQYEILELLGRLRRTRDMALVLITHDLRVAFSVCDRVYVMYAGSVVEAAPAGELSSAPQHPYSLGLLLADPPVDRRVGRLVGIPGTVPAPGGRPTGCPFAPRCSYVQPECEAKLPDLREITPGHATRCRRSEEIGDELARRRREQAASAVIAPAVAAPAPLVVARGVRKAFPGRGRQGLPTVALDGVDVHVGEGESVGLVGESGSGKTTLGRIIVGLEHASAGSVAVSGVELAARRMTRAEREAVRGTVQMAFQDPYSSLNPARAVGATIAEAVRLAGPRADLERTVTALLERVGLPGHYARRRPAELSGGERQRVAIARSLARGPRLVVCDEVVSALDVSVQAQILNLLRDLREELGLAYLFITHDLAVVRQVTDRVYVLCRGEVVEEGPTARVLDDPRHEYTQRLVASVPGAAHRGPPLEDPVSRGGPEATERHVS